MLEISWNINCIKVKKSLNNLQDIVVEVTLYPYGSDGESSIFGDNIVVALQEPDETSFVKYEDLKMDTVLNWVFAQINKAQIENDLINKFNEIKNPTIIQKVLPWSSP